VGGFYGESCPWLEATSSSFLQPREAPTWTLDRINEAPATQPRYFKTHATVEHLPRGKANIKVIHVARNPKDSVVSLYHHAKSKPEFGYTGDFQSFVNIFLAGKAENGSWFDHVLGWYRECQAKPESHLFMKYEDMYQDPASHVRKIANFLDIPVTDEVMT
jgi:sulfotransferase